MTQSLYRHAFGYGRGCVPVKSSSPNRATSNQCRPHRSPNCGDASSPSTSFPTSPSCKNAAVAGGGNPTRSAYTRRKIVRRSARGFGRIPFPASPARTCESIDPATARNGSVDHNARPGFAETDGHGAPSRTHFSIEATSASVNAPLGGIFNTPARRTACTNTLAAGSPTTIAAPRFPPASTPARESNRSPPAAVSPWQPKHRSASTGRTRASKKSFPNAATERSNQILTMRLFYRSAIQTRNNPSGSTSSQ